VPSASEPQAPSWVASTPPPTALAQRLNDALPQTQCTRCGYPSCRDYANAMAHEGVAINRCPPGGAEGIERLAQIAQRPTLPMDSSCGHEGPRRVAWVMESHCIGCTLCIKACPVDCIVGAPKRMHTVIEALCTGCELCIPVCPVDCIALEDVTPSLSGWSAWSTTQATAARTHFETRNRRRAQQQVDTQAQRDAKAQAQLADLAAHSAITDAATLGRKKALIAQALQRAQARRKPNV
jgi:Na+-translocating ferredoxin:NAD+ oxidoreductase subunit B